ncbi:MAG: hypothetical protein QXJ06_02610 [Candidatus Aenigmatarchaeota archaeon]
MKKKISTRKYYDEKKGKKLISIKLSNVITESDLELMAKECLKIKANKPFAIVLNPFKEKIPWTRAFVNLEIDVDKKIARKSSLIYDSVEKKFYRYLNNTWMEIIPFKLSVGNKSKRKKDDKIK